MSAPKRQTAVDIYPLTRDWPGPWFIALVSRIDEGDLAGAAEAQKELARLGFDVQYRPKDRLCPA